LKKAEIPYIPNVCSKIDSYKHLLEIASKFGTSSIVTQAQNGSGGKGTNFISN
jgi:biotin carboxylase